LIVTLAVSRRRLLSGWRRKSRWRGLRRRPITGGWRQNRVFSPMGLRSSVKSRLRAGALGHGTSSAARASEGWASTSCRTRAAHSARRVWSVWVAVGGVPVGRRTCRTGIRP